MNLTRRDYWGLWLYIDKLSFGVIPVKFESYRIFHFEDGLISFSFDIKLKSLDGNM